MEMIEQAAVHEPQVEINALDVDIRSDVYSLGASLYELLTGGRRHSIGAASRRRPHEDIRRIICEEEPSA